MWFIFGSFLGIGLFSLIAYLYSRKIRLTWFQWLLCALGLALLLFAIENFRASLTEYEVIAAWNSLIVFGGIAFLILTAVFLTVWRCNRKNGNEA
jgi:hypothetical protein